MEKNALLAIVLSVLVLVVWFVLFPPQQPQVTPPQESQTGQPVEPSATQPSLPVSPVGATLPTAATTPHAIDADAPVVVFESPLMTLKVTTQGARILEWRIKAHKNPQGEAVDLVSDDARRLGRLPLEIALANQQLTEEFNTAQYQASTRQITIQEGDAPATVSLTYETSTGLRITKELSVSPDSYKVSAAIRFSDPAQAGTALLVSWGPGLGTDLGSADRFEPETVSKSYGTNKLSRTPLRKIEGSITVPNIEWVAMSQKYFTLALFAEGQSNTLVVDKVVWPTQDPKEKIEIIRQTRLGLNQALQEGQCQIAIYGGPKEYKRLSQIYPGFEQIINYGMFWFIAQPLAAFMTFLYGYVKNYGVAIICLTILIKILFYPLTYKSYKSMQRMQDIQPKMKVIQDKYKTDKQRQQQEMMQLYKEEGVNPMGGCLPMLLQIPVFFGLYQALLQSIELRGAVFLWINDLSGPEPALLKFMKPLVILMGVTMFVQQSMTPTTTTDNAQAQMFKVMPILFTAMFWNMPAGLVLYWLMSNILTIGQQYLMNLTRKGSSARSKAKERSQESTASSRKQRKKDM